MVYAQVPPYLDPPSWSQQQQLRPGIAPPQQGLQAAGMMGGIGIGDAPPFQLPQTVSSMPPPRTDGVAIAVRPSSMVERARLTKAPQPEPALKCPRCDSTNTKFCYFNNYSLSQPRHFCKTCRRYWTRGGALRNVPVGGGCRRNKRSKSTASKAAVAERLPGSSTSMVMSAGSGGGLGAVVPTMTPLQLPFLGSFHGLSEYGNTSIGRMNYGSVQTTEPGQFQVGSSSTGGIPGLEQWRFQQGQQFPFFTGLEQTSTTESSLGLYQFDNEAGGVDTSSFTEELQAKPSASGLIRQLASVKMEESSQAQLSLSRQYLGMNPNGSQFWSSATSGGGGGMGVSPAWTDLSGTFGSSSTGNLL